jgi:hypothetical protein
MGQLLGPNGQPISSAQFRKASPPPQGPQFGHWAGRDVEFLNLPGGGLVQFDLSRLTLADFRTMRDHYQINASQAVLTFMVHQADWTIECENKKVRDHCTQNLELIWTRLVRAMSQSFWAGFSPNVLEWESIDRSLQLTKVKDLIPEECTVNWKLVDGHTRPGAAVAPKLKIFDGIKQRGWPEPIPTSNSFWYPLLMENGDYYGRKLMRPAFTPWFFSILVHLFANRYFERFGEPVPVGRAPYDQEVTVNGKVVKGNELMLAVLQDLRNRSVVVLPNERSPVGGETGTVPFDYAIEYLESQMRGADFERYLTRLDEEMSLGLFTPLLILRTADVGSYNLGVGHMQVYLWMLNALLADKKEYIDRYILSPMVDYNFGERAPRARIKFRKLGKENIEILRAVMTALVGEKIMPDVNELGQMTGMTLTEIEEATEPPEEPDDRVGRQRGRRGGQPRGTDEPRATGKSIAARLKGQVEKGFREGTFERLEPKMGYKKRMEKSFSAEGYPDPMKLTDELYGRMDTWWRDITALGQNEFASADEVMSLFEKTFDGELERLANAG